MKSVFFVLVFLFCSVSYAGPCEEQVFSGSGAFITFAKKELGKKLEWEMGTQWIEGIQKSTSNWNHTEANSFLKILVARIGEEKTIERLKYNYLNLENMEFGDFMQKLAFYDRIGYEVAQRSLSYSFSGFEVQNTIHKKGNIKNIRKIYDLIKSYIGMEGAVHLLMTEPTLYTQARYKEMNKVTAFVEQYTRAHKIKSRSLEQRLSQSSTSFQLIELQQAINHLPFDIWIPVRESMSKNSVRAETLRIQVTELFLALSQSTLSHLKHTVKLLENYLTPQEISEIMLEHKEIWTANSDFIQRNIDILKKTLKGKDRSILHQMHKMENREGISQEEQTRISKNTQVIAGAVQVIQHPAQLKKVISDIIREHTIAFLSSHPNQLQGTLTFLGKSMGQEGLIWLITTKVEGQNHFNGFLLAMDPAKLQVVEKTLTPYFDKKDLRFMVFENFGEIVQMDHIHFERIIKIMADYLEKQDIAEEIAIMF